MIIAEPEDAVTYTVLGKTGLPLNAATTKCAPYCEQGS
jgi:hypothetical protein